MRCSGAGGYLHFGMGANPAAEAQTVIALPKA
jgi:hypothetical protein